MADTAQWPAEFSLRGYIARQELNLRQQQLDQEREQAQQLLDYHTKQLDMLEKQHKEDMGLRKGMLKQMMQSQLNAHYGTPDQVPQNTPLSALGQPQSQPFTPNVPGQEFGIGQGLPTMSQGQTWQKNVPGFEDAFGPGGLNVDIDPNYVARENQNQLGQAAVLAKAQGMAEAEKFPYLSQLAAQQGDQKYALGMMTANAANLRNTNTNQTRELVGYLNYMKSIERPQPGMPTQSEVNSLASQILTGEVIPSGVSTPVMRAALDLIHNAGYVVPPKDARGAVGEAFGKVMGALNKAMAFAQSLPEKPGYLGSFESAVGANVPMINRDLKAKRDELKGQVLLLTRSLSDYNTRLNIPELEATESWLPTATDDRATAIKKVETMIMTQYQGLWNKAMAGMGDNQKIQFMEQVLGGPPELGQGMDSLKGMFSNQAGRYTLSDKDNMGLMIQNQAGRWGMLNPNTRKYLLIQ